MSQNTTAETIETSSTKVISETPTPVNTERKPVRFLVISCREGITETIHTLHSMGFAEAGQWSPVLPAPNHPGEFMSILTKYVHPDS
jgi:hypothetical protein